MLLRFKCTQCEVSWFAPCFLKSIFNNILTLKLHSRQYPAELRLVSGCVHVIVFKLER